MDCLELLSGQSSIRSKEIEEKDFLIFCVRLIDKVMAIVMTRYGDR